VSRSNRSLERTGLVSGTAPPRCPKCGAQVAFGTDRQGRALQHCDCGYSEYVTLRSGRPAKADDGTATNAGSEL
jgi:hypothetical protein